MTSSPDLNAKSDSVDANASAPIKNQPFIIHEEKWNLTDVSPETTALLDRLAREGRTVRPIRFS